MNDIRAITWDAPEHHHIEKGSDWYWALGVLTVGAVVAALFFGNTLFALLLGLGGFVLGITAAREPATIEFAVTVRGIRMDDRLYPYSTLQSYHIDEDDPVGPQLLVRSERMFMPLLVLPIPEQYIDDIEDILREKLPEEELEEPFINKLLEFLGF